MFIIVTSPGVSMQRDCRDLWIRRRRKPHRSGSDLPDIYRPNYSIWQIAHWMNQLVRSVTCSRWNWKVCIQLWDVINHPCHNFDGAIFEVWWLLMYIPYSQQIDGLAQDCGISNASTLKLPQSCAEPSIYTYPVSVSDLKQGENFRTRDRKYTGGRN